MCANGKRLGNHHDLKSLIASNVQRKAQQMLCLWYVAVHPENAHHSRFVQDIGCLDLNDDYSGVENQSNGDIIPL